MSLENVISRAIVSTFTQKMLSHLEVDTAIVGRFLGAERLAAVGATGSVNFLVIGLCLGLCSGFSIPVAQAFGAGNESEVRRNVWHAVVLGAVIYYIVIQIVLWMGLNTNLLKLLSALVVAVFLAIPYWKGKLAKGARHA